METGRVGINLELTTKSNAFTVVSLPIHVKVTNVLHVTAPCDDEVSGCIHGSGAPVLKAGRVRIHLEFTTDRIAIAVIKLTKNIILDVAIPYRASPGHDISVVCTHRDRGTFWISGKGGSTDSECIARSLQAIAEFPVRDSGLDGVVITRSTGGVVVQVLVRQRKGLTSRQAGCEIVGLDVARTQRVTPVNFQCEVLQFPRIRNGSVKRGEAVLVNRRDGIESDR